ncbi:MAG: putative regulatory protein RecX [Thermoleophilia bacterium]|nr:putative regulatory protein RecX [Thermoleophilia bacterium]
MARRRDIDRLKEQVGTFEAPIGAVQLPSDGVRFDKRGNPKPLQSGQDEHPEPAAPGERTTRATRQPEPELAFSTDLFVADPVERSVLSACHKVLAGTQVTVEQLRRKLVAKEFEADAIELGIEKCIAAGLLDDERYASQFVEARVRRGHGAQRIRQDLARKGIDRAVIEAALAGSIEDGALDAGAVGVARKKFARLDLADHAVRAKAYRWLASRGYTSAQVQAALAAVRQEQADEADGAS